MRFMKFRIYNVLCNMPNRITSVQECDARDDDSSNAAGTKIIFFRKSCIRRCPDNPHPAGAIILCL